MHTETAAETAAKTTDAGYKTDKQSAKKVCGQLKGSTNATKKVKPPTPGTKERLKRAVPEKKSEVTVPAKAKAPMKASVTGKPRGQPSGAAAGIKRNGRDSGVKAEG